MPKKMVIKDKKRVYGIRRRWLFNSIGVMTIILVLVMVAVCIATWGFYYSSMTFTLRELSVNTARGFNNYTEVEYRTAAQMAVSNFEYGTKLEIQFIEPNGVVLYTKYGEVVSGTVPGTPDITLALAERSAKVWSGRSPETGERIMAASAPVIYQGQSLVGVVRVVTSLNEVDRQLASVVLVCLVLMIVILGMVYFSNLFFMRSIIEPLASITDTARLIADGSYGVQIEKQFDDEVGDLIDALNDMSLKINQSEKTQSEFISSVSHELRTPLTAITGWAETVSSGELQSREDVQKGLDIILSESRRLTNMVEELLEFSRIEDGRFTLSVEPIDLKAELEDAVYTYREFFRREGITLEYDDGPEEELPISGDPQRLRQVFCNLLDNAAKHGIGGKRIEVAIYQQGEDAEITIRDHGPGIPEEELPHVKYKFYKGSSTARGSGIGLAVCEEIITRHEGELLLGNAPGGGCVVTVRLPLGT